jgi:hypothetical protein
MANPLKDIKALALPANVTPTATGLKIPDDLPDDDLLNVGYRIVCFGQAAQWWLGDWWVKTQARRWGNGPKLADQIGIPYGTLRNYASVAKAFELSRRPDKLSFNHHAAVMAVPPEDYDVWLDCAEKGDWSVAQLRSEIADTKTPAPKTIAAKTSKTQPAETKAPETKTSKTQPATQPAETKTPSANPNFLLAESITR